MSLTQEALGARIAEVRAARACDAHDLARALGMDYAALLQIEAGERRVSSYELAEIANHLRVPTLALLETGTSFARLVDTLQPTSSPFIEVAQSKLLFLAQVHHMLDHHELTSPSHDLGLVVADPIESAAGLRDLLGLEGFPSLDALTEALEARGIDVRLTPTSPANMGVLRMEGLSLLQVSTAVPQREVPWNLARALWYLLTSSSESLHVDDPADFEHWVPQVESDARRFATELLLPRSELQAHVADQPVTSITLAELLTQSAVNVETLSRRLAELARDGQISHQPGFAGAGSNAELVSLLGNSPLAAAVAVVETSPNFALRPPKSLLPGIAVAVRRGELHPGLYAQLVGEDPAEVATAFDR